MEKSTEALDEVMGEFLQMTDTSGSYSVPYAVQATLLLVAEVRMLRRALEPARLLGEPLSPEDVEAAIKRQKAGRIVPLSSLTTSPDNARVDGADLMCPGCGVGEGERHVDACPVYLARCDYGADAE